MTFPDLIGLLGTAAYLASYFLLQSGKIDAGYKYIALNLLGASLVLYSLFYAYNLSAVVTQVSWIFISIYGMYKVYSKDRESITFATIAKFKSMFFSRNSKIEK